MNAYQVRTGTADPVLLRAIGDVLTESSSPRDYLTMDETAARLGVSRSTVKRRVADGTLPAEKIGRLARIPMSAVQGAGGIDANC